MRLWVIALLMLAPAASAAPVDLYWHLSGIMDAPLNTQEPAGEQVVRYGLATHSACVPVPGMPVSSESRHTWYAYAAPGFVEYDFTPEGQPRFHVERGLAMDLHLDAQEQVVMTWHLAATGPDERLDAVAAVIPDVILEVTVREGDDPSLGQMAFNTGKLVAQGRVGPVTLHPGVTNEHVSAHTAGDLNVYRFEVPLDLANTTVSQREGMNIRIDAMMDNPHCADQDGYIMPDLVSPYQGPGHWNRLHVGVQNPLILAYVHPQIIKQDLVIHASAMSPFGTYDLGHGAAFVLDGPVELPVQYISGQDRAHVHGHPGPERVYEPAWIIDTSEAEPGLYKVQILLENLQGTASVAANVTFEIGDGTIRICEVVNSGNKCTTHGTAGVEVPALAPLAPLAAALLMRRRT